MSTVPAFCQFCKKFNDQCFLIPGVPDTNNFLNSFNQLCSSTLDVIAPVKPRSNLKIRKQPWLNESCRAYKRNFRKAERRWKKSGLQVHFLTMKEHLLTYYRMVKNARTYYFSNLISANKCDPRFLFKTVDQLVNPVPPESDADCEKFLLHFVGKVENIRLSITTNPTITDVSPPYRYTLSIFTPISLPELLKINSNMSVSSSPLDIIPTKFLIVIKECIGPHLLTILNRHLTICWLCP